MASGPLRLSMVMTADAAGVKAGAADAVRAMDGVSAANDRAAASARRAAEAARGQSAAERDLRASIDRGLGVGSSVAMVGTPFAGDAARGRDIAAYGRELDNLRAKYNPLFAEIMRYRTALSEIRQAHSVGAISTNEMTEAISRERQAALASIAALKGRGAALREAAVAARIAETTGGAGAFQTANIAAQFQDIGVTAAMGMSPLQVGLQQGTQLAAVLNAMEKPAQGLLAALTAVLNPLSLITIGAVAAGTALIQYFSSGEDETKALDAALDAHAQNIQDIREKWSDAAGGVEEYVQKSGDLIRAQNLLAGIDLKEQLDEFTRRLVAGGELVRTETERIRADIDRVGGAMGMAMGNPEEYDRLNRELEGLLTQLERAGTDALTAAERFAPFKEEIDAFAASVHAGTPDFIALQDAIARGLLSDPTNEELQRLAKSVADLVKEGEELQRRMPANASALDAIGTAAARNQAAVDGLAKALEALSNIALPRLDDRALALSELQRGMAAAAGLEQRRQVTQQYDATLERIRLAEEGAAAPTPTSRPNDIERDNWLFEAERSGGGRAKVSDFDREIERIQQRTAALDAEANVVGLSTFAAEKYLATQRLEAAAREDAIGLTPARIAAIDAETTAYARRVAAAEEAIEAERRAAEEMQFQRDLLGSTLSDIRGALDDGQIGWEELADVAINALGRIADKIQDDLLDAIFEANNAVSGGGSGGGILGFLGGLLGLGGGSTATSFASGILDGTYVGLYHDGRYPGRPGGRRLADPAWFVDAPRYHNGRIPGLAPDEEAAIVRKSEPIFRDMDHARQVVGGAGTIVQVVDQRSGGSIEREEGIGPNGEQTVRLIVRDEINRYDGTLPNKVHGKIQSVQQNPRRMTGNW